MPVTRGKTVQVLHQMQAFAAPQNVHSLVPIPSCFFFAPQKSYVQNEGEQCRSVQRQT